MQFKVVQDVVKSITNTIQTTTIGAVRSIRSNTYSVNVKNWKKSQIIKGTVTVGNQKRVEKELKAGNKTLISLLSWVKLFKFPKEIEVSNFPDFPKFPKFPESFRVSNFPKQIPYPKNIRVTNQPTKELDEIYKCVETVNKSIKKLKLDPKITVQAPKPEKIIVPPANVSVTQKEIDYKKLAALIPVPKVLDINKLAEAIAKEIAESIVSVGGGSGGGSGRGTFKDSQGRQGYGLINNLRQLSTVSEDRWGLNNSSKSGNITYTGEQDVDGNWIIRKITKNGGNIAMTYATIINNSGYTTYSTAWAAKAELEYGLFQVAFEIEE